MDCEISKSELLARPGQINGTNASLSSAFGPARSRSFGRAFTQTFLGNLLVQACGVITGILAARLLGATGRGELAAIFYYPGTLAQLGSLGLHQAVAYQTSRRPEDEDKILRSGFWTAVVLGVPQFVLGALLASSLLPKDMANLAPTLQWFMAFPLLAYCSYVLLAVDQGTFRFGRYSALTALPSIFYAIGALIIWITGTASPPVFAAFCLGGHVFALAIRLRLSGSVLLEARPRWDQAVNLLRRGLAFHVPQVTGILMAQSDMLIVLYVLPVDQVGLYAVALAIAQGQMAASGAFAQVGFVKVAGETDRGASVASLWLHFRVAQVIGVAIAALFILISPYLIFYAIGPDFMGACLAADCLIVALALRGLANILDYGLRALGHTWVPAFGYGVAFVVMVIGALLWVPKGGIEAMGAVMIVAVSVMLFINIFALTRLEGADSGDFWGFRVDVFRFIKSRCASRF